MRVSVAVLEGAEAARSIDRSIDCSSTSSRQSIDPAIDRLTGVDSRSGAAGARVGRSIKCPPKPLRRRCALLGVSCLKEHQLERVQTAPDAMCTRTRRREPSARPIVQPPTQRALPKFDRGKGRIELMQNNKR